jgi:hypothetical protein
MLRTTLNLIMESLKCPVPENLNIKIRAKKGSLGDPDLWRMGQAIAAASPHVAGAD